MRITIVSPGFDSYCVSLCRALSARGEEVTLFTGSLAELPIVRMDFRVRSVFKIGNRALRHWPVPLRKLRNGGAVLLGLLIVATESAARPPAIAHLQGGMYASGLAVLCLGLLRLTGARVVYTPHNNASRFRSRFARRWWNLQFRLADAVVVHSEIARERLISTYGRRLSRVEVIPHGNYNIISEESPQDKSQARRIRGIPEEADVALVFGHIREYKGLDLAIQTLAAVVKTHPNARLLIAGREVVSADRYRFLASQLGVESCIDWSLGWIKPSEVWTYFVSSDFVLVSYRDSGEIDSSGVVALGQSFGRPVLATDVGGIGHQVGRAGIVVPPEDVQGLARSWRLMMEDKALRVELSSMASLKAKSDSWSDISQATAALYSDLLATRKPVAGD